MLSQILNRVIPGLGMLLSGMLQNIFASHLSRKDEFEADAYASALMLKTGFDINAQKTLLKKLKKLNPNDTKTPAWLLSHPPIEDRVQQIEQNVAKWTTTPKTQH
jgi:putative metalloprotease